jgi:hypothetical protein
MSVSTVDLAKARETAKAILEELQLDAYTYEVEPHNSDWEVKIECACDIDGGWETVTLKVPKEMLLDSYEDYKAKQSLFAYWKKKLRDCKVRETSSTQSG